MTANYKYSNQPSSKEWVLFANPRDWLLVLALLSYGIGGDPLPNSLNLALILTGTLLILYVGPKLSIATGTGLIVEKYLNLNDSYYAVSTIIFLFLLATGLIGTIAYHNTLDDAVRDIIPHAFFFFTVFVGVRICTSQNPQRSFDMLALLLGFAGTMISWRFLSIVTPAMSAIGTERFAFDNFLRLSFDPSVLFSAVFLPIAAVEFFNINKPWRIAGSVLMLIGGLICLGALGSTVSRGPLILALASYAGYFIYSGPQSPWRLILAGVIAFLFYILFASQINGVISLAVQKMLLHGDNGRFDEYSASFIAAGQNIWIALIGEGWGGLLSNPYRPGANFSFTHSVLTYYLLKTGFIGAAAISVYIIWTISRGISILKNRPAVFFGAISSLTYCLMVQPTYKALTCGLILALISTGPDTTKPIRS